MLDLDSAIRAEITEYDGGTASTWVTTIRAVLDLHHHKFTNQHGQATGKYGGGRCQECGNNRPGPWCATLVTIAEALCGPVEG